MRRARRKVQGERKGGIKDGEEKVGVKMSETGEEQENEGRERVEKRREWNEEEEKKKGDGD